MLKSFSKAILHHGARLSCPVLSTVKRGFSDLIQISDEVQNAVANKQAVVALESTIITHGMPPPDNLQVALDVEDIVRQNGAVPATIAVLDGRIHIGMNTEQMDQLVNCTEPIKVSRRDLAYVLSQRATGGTTVSCTMIAAHMAGIDVFVTGGIGGVHRGAELSFDVSADLTELGRTPVAVISSGVKSILDIEKTLEYLETQGVFVGSYGTEKFPSFFTADSGFKSPYMLNSIHEAASAIACNLSLGLKSGMLIAVPIPQEFEASGEMIESAIQQAVQKTNEHGIKGKDVTPFVLEQVNSLTEGQSLQANKALIKNNASIGSQIAVELSKIKRNGSALFNRKKGGHSTIQKRTYSSHTFKQGRPVVVGGMVVDFVITADSDNVQFLGATYPGHVRQSFGGVGRNVADGLARLECNPFLISVIGDDMQADAFNHYSNHMDLSGVKRIENHSTPSYYAVLKKSGELLFGVGDMELHSFVTPDYISNFESQICEAPLVFVDGNIPADSIEYICDVCHTYKVPVWFDPTDINKAEKPFTTTAKDKLTFISPNYNELRVMYETLTGEECPSTKADLSTRSTEDVLEEARDHVSVLLDHVPTIFASLGEHGLVLGSRLAHQTTKTFLHYQACSKEQMLQKIVSVSGAGDCMSAATIFGLLRGMDMDSAVKAGLLAAQYSLQHLPAVPGILTPDLFSYDRIHSWARWNPRTLNSSPDGDSIARHINRK